MAVVIPYVKQAWTDGSSSASAARFGVIEDGVFDAHNMPTVKAVRTTTQSITSSTWTLCAWNATDAWDTDTMHDIVTNNERLIAKHAGKFQWTIMHNWQGNATGQRLCEIQKNSVSLPATGNTGVVQGGYANTIGASLTDTYIGASGIVDLAVNDYIAAVVYQNSGGALTIGTDSYFSMTRLAT